MRPGNQKYFLSALQAVLPHTTLWVCMYTCMCVLFRFVHMHAYFLDMVVPRTVSCMCTSVYIQ
jgi:hypothetical protein